MTKLPSPTERDLSIPISQRPTIIDRDRRRRLRLALETAVPVLIRSDVGTQRGLVRNISEGGMLIEVAEPPSIGTAIEVFVDGQKGSRSAPETARVLAEVRHHIQWNFRESGEARAFSAIGVRYTKPPEPSVLPGTSVH